MGVRSGFGFGGAHGVKKVAELFENVEINREPRWPILARLVAASLLLHVTLVASAIYVPAVRNALNIASVFSDAKYVDEDYDRTIVGERAEVIDLAQDKFRYPEGYFAAGEPQPDPFAPQIITETQSAPVFIPPKPLPTPQPSPVPSPTPQPSPSASPAVAATTTPGTTPGGATTPTTDTSVVKPAAADAEKDLNKIAAEHNVERPSEDAINKKPLKDWLARANELKTKGELDLSGTIEMIIEAELDEDGTLHDPLVVQKTGDPRLIAVAKELVAAIGDSKVLGFMKKDARKLRITIKLDQDEVMAKVESEVGTPERAQQLSQGYNLLLVSGAFVKKGQDEEVLYKSTSITADGKQVVVNFKMPRAIAGAMLSKHVPTG
jgi:outer membrane biosynthesis protein TonB